LALLPDYCLSRRRYSPQEWSHKSPTGKDTSRPVPLRPVQLFEHCAGYHVLHCSLNMARLKKNDFSRRLPDLVTEELLFVLSQETSYEFKQLFEVVDDKLRRRNAVYVGEELLRLRVYEKLQNLVLRGTVKKNGKIYTGNSAVCAAMAANAPHAAAVTSTP
jgi:hypothetical protein